MLYTLLIVLLLLFIRTKTSGMIRTIVDVAIILLLIVSVILPLLGIG